MEQIIGTFGIDWRLLLLQAFNFGLTLLVLWYFLYRPVLRILDERREKIARGVRDAEEATEHVKLAEGKGKAMLSKAEKEAEELLGRANKHGAEREREMLAEAQKKSDRLLEEAVQRSAEERRKALDSSREEIARMAVLAAEKVLLEKKTTH